MRFDGFSERLRIVVKVAKNERFESKIWSGKERWAKVVERWWEWEVLIKRDLKIGKNSYMLSRQWNIPTPLFLGFSVDFQLLRWIFVSLST